MKATVLAIGLCAASPAIAGEGSWSNVSERLIHGADDAGVSGPNDLIFQNGFEAAPPPVPPEVAKDFIPNSIQAGTTSLLVISMGNANATSATLTADLVDTFPQNLVIVNPSDVATTCASGTVTGVAGSGSVTLAAGAQIPANGSCEITVSVTSAFAGTYTNTIPAGALQTDLGNSTVNAARDLTVTDAAVCNPVQVLQDFGFELTDNSSFPYVNPFWTGTSMNFLTPFCDEAGCGNDGGSALPHSGLFWAWLGRAHVGNVEGANVAQDVIIPAGQPRFLNYWLWIGAIGVGTTNLDVSVDGTIVASIPEPTVAEAGYTQRSVDVSSFADGNLHSILFSYISPGPTSSNYSLDDVTLDCTQAPITWPLPALHIQGVATGRNAH